ncbi:1-aminocyclopropane-1-carboxylate synthase [Parafrankia irregularis]|uniref:1-aminocyclopropane-1-carboxylate synthase n=1 Tax=Parafrankia irregularis TaxID=795642 RepID=A0A0S4QTK1_9ACTN|nr:MULTISPECIES: aminotransferase class I/II-fold pyridoxal phosphate-dependent enzyme [Parafrankia]MBE3202451.1 aminotransferase class I/II-fold pyridoxal phosphate-dependent enzyme [Parafrankia sp. CH37]CUU58967.1 1-aminocyclopropane-1-carboxylate synthase [Parafrankia irregularis]
MVSRRAAALAAQPPAIAVAHFRAEAYPYDARLRPDGYINLGTAENRLVWDLLAPRLTARRALTAADTHYGPLHGTDAFRQELARFLGGVCRTEIDPDHLVVVSGVTGALDVIATVLCDPGEAIVVPAPYYSAFDVDLVGRSGARLLPVPVRADQGFQVTPDVLDEALAAARAGGVTVRAVALASPGNPVGHVLPPRVLREIVAVAARHGVDVVVDEIYANSVFGDSSFVSALDPEAGAAGTGRVHVVWGFAKDFGLPGLKIGVLCSPDPQVCAAARALAYFAATSTDTQALLRDLLADREWVIGFLAESRRRLGRAYRSAAGLLTVAGIPFVPVEAGFSLWVDLRGWLTEPTFAAEDELWARILDEARVNVLPGRLFASPDPGWFRLCFATAPAVVSQGVDRIARLLGGLCASVPASASASAPEAEAATEPVFEAEPAFAFRSADRGRYESAEGRR